MQPSRNFDDLKFSSIHRRILLWGSGGPFLDGYVPVSYTHLTLPTNS
ncbi:hypothetical protein ACX3VG_05240, partial [Escherichia coli]